jgi:hypothetical protein
MWAIHLASSKAALAHPSNMERVMGIEPTSSAWKAEVLPLNYTRLKTQQTMTPYIGTVFKTFASHLNRYKNAFYLAYKNPDSLGL